MRPGSVVPAFFACRRRQGERSRFIESERCEARASGVPETWLLRPRAGRTGLGRSARTRAEVGLTRPALIRMCRRPAPTRTRSMVGDNRSALTRILRQIAQRVGTGKSPVGLWASMRPRSGPSAGANPGDVQPSCAARSGTDSRPSGTHAIPDAPGSRRNPPVPPSPCAGPGVERHRGGPSLAAAACSNE